MGGGCSSEFLFTTYLLRQLSNISPKHLQEANIGHNPSLPTSKKGWLVLGLQGIKTEPSEGKQNTSGLQGNIFLRECNNFFLSRFLLELTFFTSTGVLGSRVNGGENESQKLVRILLFSYLIIQT